MDEAEKLISRILQGLSCVVNSTLMSVFPVALNFLAMLLMAQDMYTLMQVQNSSS